MLLFENVALAFSGLMANKMRALLTMLGIIIGIGSVIAIMTVGNSMTSSVTSTMQSMGANNINVRLTQKSSTDSATGREIRMFFQESYKEEDLISDAMLSEYEALYADDIYAIGLSSSLGGQTAKNNTLSASVYLTGANGGLESVEALKLLNGRFLNQNDGERTVCVISDVLSEALFGHNNAIGQAFSLTYGAKVYSFYVIGIYEYEQSTDSTLSSTTTTPSTNMYIPLELANKISGGQKGYSSFTVISEQGTNSDEFMQATKSFFQSFYTRNTSYTVTASSMESMLESMTGMVSTISLAISVIAGISLLVGGIGVMNIMLVSITERTREIGTRKALGATNGSIRVQFIVEAVIICLTGGFIGIALGAALGSAGAELLGYAAVPSAAVILLAAAFSIIIGVFFGYYPANKAAKLCPIDALRYE